jgi:O-acetyl-ADP-ribose deacetylase (regulator of RNase III)
MHAAVRKRIEGPHAWTHPSVLALESTGNPVDTIVRKARQVVFSAIQKGWPGPPYDPFALAELLKIQVEPSQDVLDARIVPTPERRFKIEFNPNRSRARINFSVAHEIAHTFFPDCASAIRNRTARSEVTNDTWQLEMLCNISAAEILMPTGSFRFDDRGPITIDAVIALQREFAVSTESVLLRIAKLTGTQCFVFAAHKFESEPDSPYRIDYFVPSRTLKTKLPSGMRLPTSSVVAHCTAIGFTSKAIETWQEDGEQLVIECLGVGPYPGDSYPRVVGIARPKENTPVETVQISYVRGDATQPRGAGAKLLVQVVNDKAISWGRGFSLSVRNRWPDAQKDYTRWAVANKSKFKLGNVHVAELGDSAELVSLVAQHGYGPSLFPRIQYAELAESLSKLASIARCKDASIHMPRIGAGEAGGDWRIISEIIDETLCKQNIPVTVYDLPVANKEGQGLNRRGAC